MRKSLSIEPEWLAFRHNIDFRINPRITSAEPMRTTRGCKTWCSPLHVPLHRMDEPFDLAHVNAIWDRAPMAISHEVSKQSARALIGTSSPELPEPQARQPSSAVRDRCVIRKENVWANDLFTESMGIDHLVRVKLGEPTGKTTCGEVATSTLAAALAFHLSWRFLWLSARNAALRAQAGDTSSAISVAGRVLRVRPQAAPRQCNTCTPTIGLSAER
jgi:hypothetical protein